MDVDPVAFDVESSSQKRVAGSSERKNLKRTAPTDSEVNEVDSPRKGPKPDRDYETLRQAMSFRTK